MFVNKYDVKCIAFNDIKYIGTSYPFLISSGTSGTLFISAFIHIMRNYGVDVIMSSSESEYPPSNEEISKATVLSDAILHFHTDGVNGASPQVQIYGEGQIVKNRQVSIHLLDRNHNSKIKEVTCAFRFNDKNSAILKAFRIDSNDEKKQG